MTITDKDIKELENKLKDKVSQKAKRKRYKQIRFEYNHPILYKFFKLFAKKDTEKI